MKRFNPIRECCRWLAAIFRIQDKMIFECIIVGILSGFVVVTFRSLSMLLEAFRINFLENSATLQSYPIYILFLVLSYILIWKLILIEPLVRSSGILQVQAYMIDKLHMNWLSVLIGKFLGALVSIGVGISLGQEGPSIQLGAAMGHGVGQWFGSSKNDTKYLVSSGISAGMAAAFGAPLAGVMFCLEETHKNIDSRILISCLVAAVSADIVSKKLFGMSPALCILEIETLPLSYYFCVVILGIGMALLGTGFNKVLLISLDYFNINEFVWKKYRRAMPFFIAGILSLWIPQALGSGHQILHGLGDMHYSIYSLVLLFIVKFLFTILCCASGVPGGVLLPILALGGVLGAIFAWIFGLLFNLPTLYMINIVVYAMLAYFTAIVRSPLTGIILISELIGSFQHFLPLAMVAAISYLVADLMECEPLYESLMNRSYN